MPGYTMQKQQLQTRLRRIEGQVRGVARMIDEDKYCVDVVTQLAAIQAALDKVSLGLLDGHIRGCVREEIKAGGGDAKVDELLEVMDRVLAAEPSPAAAGRLTACRGSADSSLKKPFSGDGGSCGADLVCGCPATGAAVVAIGWGLRRTDELGRPRQFPWVTVALLLAMGVGAAVPGVLRASQERCLGGAASVLAGARVAVRCQSLGGAFVDGGPELGYVRRRADGSPEPWALIKRDQCHHLAAYVRSGARRPTRDQGRLAVHVLTHEAMNIVGPAGRGGGQVRGRPARRPDRPRLPGARPANAAALAAAYWQQHLPADAR